MGYFLSMSPFLFELAASGFRFRFEITRFISITRVGRKEQEERVRGIRKKSPRRGPGKEEHLICSIIIYKLLYHLDCIKSHIHHPPLPPSSLIIISESSSSSFSSPFIHTGKTG